MPTRSGCQRERTGSGSPPVVAASSHSCANPVDSPLIGRHRPMWMKPPPRVGHGNGQLPVKSTSGRRL